MSAPNVSSMFAKVCLDVWNVTCFDSPAFFAHAFIRSFTYCPFGSRAKALSLSAASPRTGIHAVACFERGRYFGVAVFFITIPTRQMSPSRHSSILPGTFHSVTHAVNQLLLKVFFPRWRRERFLIIFGGSRNDINSPTPERT